MPPKIAKAKRAWPTIYDAISSRVNYEGFIRPAFLNEFKEERVRSGVARPADEVLARRIRAPDYVAPVDSKEYDARLPDNDLMIAIHQYASDFYSAHGMAPISSKSMDESALIAMGLLLEETIEQLLGGGGHLALVDKRALHLRDEGAVWDEQDEYYDEVVPTELEESEEEEI
ncbi:hypothetical protein BDD12DRAFT_869838 [Trichophaea hybrida]|nr:hypothetical protein BDD12DRAFT_869838 [Trichophaea hybrida]